MAKQFNVGCGLINKRRNCFLNATVHYGHEDLDMTQSEYEVAKTMFLQRHSFTWSQVRRLMLTSTYFGRILNVNSRCSFTKIVEEIVYENIQYTNTAEVRHQRIYEVEGLSIFSKLYPYDPVYTCGIFIDEKLSFLGATPLRICGDNAIVVVKCPKKEFGKSMTDAIETLSFWAGTYSNRRINKKSHWFFEIQGQLHIAKKQLAHLVIYLGGESYEIVEIERNDVFWNEKMEKELCYFYNEALLKELIDPRNDRGMELRKYNPKKEIFE